MVGHGCASSPVTILLRWGHAHCRIPQYPQRSTSRVSPQPPTVTMTMRSATAVWGMGITYVLCVAEKRTGLVCFPVLVCMLDNNDINDKCALPVSMIYRPGLFVEVRWVQCRCDICGIVWLLCCFSGLVCLFSSLPWWRSASSSFGASCLEEANGVPEGNMSA